MPKDLEIERKYLIRMPDESLLASMPDCEIWDITQTYLKGTQPGETRRVREIRHNGKITYIYTYKAAISAMTHIEKERELTGDEYAAMLETADPDLNPIIKRRYRVPHAAQLMEIDIYTFWSDRATLEIELESESEEPCIPDWLDIIRDVTGEPAYKNRVLAESVPMEELPPAAPRAGTRAELLSALRDVAAGKLSPEAMLRQLKVEPFQDLEYARIDHHRGIRQGAAEVIYGAGKTPEQILGICKAMSAAGHRNILITRMSEEAAAVVGAQLPLFRDPLSRIGIVNREPAPLRGCVVVACGGTSDLYAAEEAALTCETLGSRVVRLYDVGVSGIHRLLSQMNTLAEARCVIAVAGMEGALASVVGGLVDCPVIAVPTSVGYGANFGGLSALLSMLNSCASGVSVVNIDNGFGAGYLANTINMMESIPEN